MSKKIKQGKKIQKGTITSAILSAVGETTVVATALIAPNALRALEELGIVRTSKADDIIYIRKATTRLTKRGLVSFHQKKGKKFAELTEKGKLELAKYQLREFVIQKPRVWDGHFRVLIFDIREERRGTRDKLRMELHNLGFYMVQQSVWAHAHNCEEVIVLLKAHLRLGKDVIYMVVKRIDSDREIKKHFQLS